MQLYYIATGQQRPASVYRALCYDIDQECETMLVLAYGWVSVEDLRTVTTRKQWISRLPLIVIESFRTCILQQKRVGQEHQYWAAVDLHYLALAHYTELPALIEQLVKYHTQQNTNEQ